MGRPVRGRVTCDRQMVPEPLRQVFSCECMLAKHAAQGRRFKNRLGASPFALLARHRVVEGVIYDTNLRRFEDLSRAGLVSRGRGLLRGREPGSRSPAGPRPQTRSGRSVCTRAGKALVGM